MCRSPAFAMRRGGERRGLNSTNSPKGPSRLRGMIVLVPLCALPPLPPLPPSPNHHSRSTCSEPCRSASCGGSVCSMLSDTSSSTRPAIFAIDAGSSTKPLRLRLRKVQCMSRSRPGGHSARKLSERSTRVTRSGRKDTLLKTFDKGEYSVC